VLPILCRRLLHVHETCCSAMQYVAVCCSLLQCLQRVAQIYMCGPLVNSSAPYIQLTNSISLLLRLPTHMFPVPPPPPLHPLINNQCTHTAHTTTHTATNTCNTHYKHTPQKHTPTHPPHLIAHTTGVATCIRPKQHTYTHERRQYARA